MTQFSNQSFSVAGRRCNGCEQRDVWIKQKEERIKELEEVLGDIADGDGDGCFDCGYNTRVAALKALGR